MYMGHVHWRPLEFLASYEIIDDSKNNFFP